jgi:hypothetical protein
MFNLLYHIFKEKSCTKRLTFVILWTYTFFYTLYIDSFLMAGRGLIIVPFAVKWYNIKVKMGKYNYLISYILYHFGFIKRKNKERPYG